MGLGNGRPQRGWMVLIWLGLGLALVLLVIGSLSISHTQNDSVASNASAAPAATRPAADPQQLQDKKRLDTYLRVYGSGYDCDANNGVENIGQLQLCPDFVAAVVFNAKGKPVIDEKSNDDGGRKPISITVAYEKICGNDGVQGAPINCGDFWRIRWKVNVGYVPLGYNQETANVSRSDGSHWAGPTAIGQTEGDKLVAAETTHAVEVYAGDPQRNTSPAPLSADRQDASK